MAGLAVVFFAGCVPGGEDGSVVEPVPPGFAEVRIESHPAGGGYAEKTAYPDGRVRGSHESGGAGGVFVHQTDDRMSPADFEPLKALIARVLAADAPPPTGAKVDQSKGHFKLIIVVGPKNTREFLCPWEGKFASPDVQAIADLLFKQRVGAW